MVLLVFAYECLKMVATVLLPIRIFHEFHLGSMGVDAKPVTKTLDVYICQPDSKNGETDRKAKLAPQQSEQP
ncbi:hypothetical protein MKW98_024432 [Papaver atlanticum]|uniref:Uncharacterized protein n=1 Tax=Papaver atlanticum TaxID=357466 RepID=A0AAD4T135_9MAGN|nr:hypothetical protein MKW98_024432 [Papaver atlanticum]